MKDELNKILDSFAEAIESGDMVLDVKEMETIPAIEAYIKTNYILKAQVVEAIGEDQPRDLSLSAQGKGNITRRARNTLRAELRESLNLEGGRDGQK